MGGNNIPAIFDSDIISFISETNGPDPPSKAAWFQPGLLKECCGI